MSADINDVARIQDEDVLRRMWQETNDFGKKKEIRSHMYKLREARLKDFYNSAEVNTDIHRSTTTTSTTENKSKTNMSTTHADSLADQSYVTLKSKEVRDSESPTRDSYNKTIAKHQDQGWAINTSNERSLDGKTHSTTHTATTSGTQQIDGGNMDYSAKLEEKASVFQDGDDKNFTKAVGTSSSSVIRQEASGGDENSNFRSTSSKTSSSSRYVSESKNSYEDVQALPSSTTVTREQVPYSTINEDNARSVVQKSYTTNVPSDLKNHPNYIEGKTKVTQETKTLADGTVVTTTRYETKQGNSTQTATHKKYSNVASSHAEQKISSSRTHEQSSRNVSDSKQSARNDQRSIEYIVEPGSTVDINLKQTRENIDRQNQELRNINKSEKVSTTQQTSKSVRESSQHEQINRQNDSDVRKQHRLVQDKVEYVEIPRDQTVTTRTTTTKTVVSQTPQQQTDVRQNQRVIQENVQYIQTNPVDQTNTTKTTTTKTIRSDQIPQEQINTTYHTTSTHVINEKQDVRDNKKVVNDQFISTERQHEVDTRNITIQQPSQQAPKDTRPLEEPYRQPSQEAPSKTRPVQEPYRQQPSKPSQSPSEPEKYTKAPQESYVQPDRRQPFKPGKSELDQTPTPTEGQYETTYRNDFTSKKISVEVSATHDAFARSLRSVTPERITRGSPRTDSNPSLRSTSSPEKMRYPSRASPDRQRSKSPKKSTDRFSSTETITYKTNRASPTRKSPDRYPTDKKSFNGDITVSKTTKSNQYSTDTITRRSKTTKEDIRSDTIDSSTLTRKKNRPRSPSPTGTTTSDFEYVRNTKDVTTDLDDLDHTSVTTTKDTRPSSLEITTRKVKKVTERSPTSPLTDLSSPRRSPTKESPKKERSPTKDTTPTYERPRLVRTDTYEERVKEILGLAKDTKEIRRSSLERNSLKRSSLRETNTRTTSSDDITRRLTKSSPTKETPRRSPEKQSPTKEKPSVSEFPSQIRKSPETKTLPQYPEKKYPSKSSPGMSEFPSQIRRSPEERQPLQPYPEKTSPIKTPSKISEFPSQIRKSPEREILEPYPERSSPNKSGPTIYEFPSQIRRSPERQPLEPYPEKSSPTKAAPSVSEFPSQVRKSPEREPLEPYPERKSPTKSTPTVSEFPSQVRKSLEKQPLEPYVEKTSPTKSVPSVSEFPSQIRRSPEREPLEPYPERKSPTKSAPSVSEFPSQVRKSPEKQPLEPYPERTAPTKSVPSVSEFPSQIRRSPEREPLEPYPERKSPTRSVPTVSEFPSQVRKSPEKQPLESYPERTSPTKSVPSVSEFPSQIRRSPERETLEPYPERKTPTKSAPTVSEFPSQIRKSPEKQPAKKHPDNRASSPKKSVEIITRTTKKAPKQPNKLRTTSESSTTSEEDIEERITETTVETLESRTPVSEPIAEKKLFSQLCKADEVIINKKKTTQDLIEAEILDNEITRRRSSTTVKKQKPIPNGISPTDISKKPTLKKPTTTTTTTTSEVTKTEGTNRISTLRKDVPKERIPIKKPAEKTPSRKIIETTISTRTVKKDSPKTISYSPKIPTPKKQSETIYRVEKTKFIGQTEYQDEFSKTNKLRREPIRKQLKHGSKTTIYDIEQSEKIKEDKSIHLRTNRVDDTVTRKKVTKSVFVNGDVNKPKVSPARIPTPTKKTPVSVTKPIEKTTEPKAKQTTITQSRYSSTLKTTLNDAKPKGIKPTEPKKHMVSTTITVSPKTGPKSKPTTKTTGSKTVLTTKATATTKHTSKRVSNGYGSSDTDDESIVESVEGSFIDLTDKKDQFTRTTTDRTSPKRGYSKPDLYSDDEETTKRVITTKTVLITNKDAPDREVIVNLQRSKSSREPTPDRLCPRPLTSDEEEDASPARYPDQISEPDEGSLKRKPKKLSDIPIFETDDSEYTRITEMTDSKSKITKVDKVEETDESLLSIDKKINKFLTTADKLTKEPVKPKPEKIDRPIVEISDDLKEDECLLSVSDKVSKFINTAEQLTTSTLPGKAKSPRPQTYDGVTVNIQKKVTEFKTSVDESNRPKIVGKGPAPRVSRPDLDDIDDSLKEDECLLSVSDKVSKFISTADKLTTSTTTNKPVSLSKIEIRPNVDEQSPQNERRYPSRDTSFKTDRKSASRDVTTDFIQTERKEEIITRKSPSSSPERQRSPTPGDRTPNRRPSNQYDRILKTETTHGRYTPTQPISPEPTPKSTRRSSQEDSKTSISSTTRLRSTESIKKAKALFENIGKEHDTTTWQKDILSRPSVFDAKKTSKTEKTTSRIDVDERQEIKRRSSTQKITDDKTTKIFETVSRRSQSPQKSPERTRTPEKIEITRFRSRSPEKLSEVITSHREVISEKSRSREPTPDGDLPHYMKPLDRSLRPNSPHRSNISEAKPQQPQQPQLVDQVDIRQTKFGVTLRRTDSGRTTKTTESSTTSTERRKSSITLEKRITEEEIEEIFDLEVLEELLEKVVGYELRRKLRTQIRLVKKLISEGTLETYVSKKKSYPREAITRRGSSPSKTIKPEGLNKTTEYQSTYTRKISPERKTVDNKLYEHTDIVDKRSSVERSSEYQSSYSCNERRSSTECSKVTRKSASPVRDRGSPQRSSPDRRVSKTTDSIPGGKITTVKTTENIPGGTRTTTTKTSERTFTTLKKTAPSSRKPVEDNQPEWVRQRNLKNTKDSAVQAGKKVSTTTTTTKKSTLRTSPAKEVKGTDIITSSYGVGPTDENGTPLFGLKALRAQNKNEKMKVQGTVIRSEYYSENDQEPVGQVSITKYSTDPRDLEQDGVSIDGKLSSVTTTQKFGYKDTPSLRSLTDKRKEICDTTEKSTTKTTKVNRRGSVKEISKKFIDNAVETLKSERQTTYPKAGLILRTSSFKSTNGEGEPDSRESSPADDRQAESSTVTVRTMRTSTSGETFLSNKNKISGVQDVITRMKNEEYEAGDTEEDIAARGLLNKFIGSQVILTGMEARAASSNSKTTTSTSPSGTVRRSTKITTTITEGGKPTTTTRVFQRPVREQELETVWDEQSLRLLLEQSTDYEERRIIRVRLRQVMAEQEEAVETTEEVKKEGDVTTTQVTTKVTQQQTRAAPKPISPFAKFRQLDKQNSVNKPTPPRTFN